MTKIMLVEDDNNLREIYGARLMAEGYQIVSAADGEEALALAVKEKPELIVADVMMPKISGFDMLDILRTTPETKDTKVIIMTALSQPEDRARGEALGADKYLVKSQVTLEDVVAAVHEILGDNGATAPSSSNVNETMPVGSDATTVAPQDPTEPATPPIVQSPPPAQPEPTDEQPPKAEGASDAPEPASKKKKVIKPINDLGHEKADFLKMVAEEEAREKQAVPGASVGPTDDATQEEQQTKMAETMAEEKKKMDEDVKKMVNDGTIDSEAAAPIVQPDINQSPAATGSSSSETNSVSVTTPDQNAAGVPQDTTTDVASSATGSEPTPTADEPANTMQPGTSVGPQTVTVPNETPDDTTANSSEPADSTPVVPTPPADNEESSDDTAEAAPEPSPGSPGDVAL